MARHIPPRRVPRDRFVFSQGSGSAGGIFGGASIPGAHTHLEIDITDLDKYSVAGADATFLKLDASNDPLTAQLEAPSFTGDFFQFDLTFADGTAEGRLQWNIEDGTLEFGLPGGVVNLQVGQETVIRARNQSGATIPNGAVVRIVGASGNKPLLALADASSEATAGVLGVTTEELLNNSNGYVTVSGLVRDVDTSGTTEGDLICLSETAGEFTTTRPTPPAIGTAVGHIIAVHATMGVIHIAIAQHSTLNHEVSDVLLANLVTNELLQWTGSVFENKTLAEAGISALGHTHLEADITDLKAYLELAGGTMTGDLILNKATPVITLDATGVTDSSFSFAVIGVSRFVMGFESLSSSYKLNIGGSLSARSDFVMDGTGKVSFGTTPEVTGTAVSLVGHTHLEADITDLKAYLELAGGTMTGDLFLTKTTPGLRMNATGTSNGFIAWQDDGSSKFIMGWKNSEASFKLNIGSSLAARSDFVMDATGKVSFGVTPEVGGTTVSLAGHTHLEADITDLKAYLELAGGTMTGNLDLGTGDLLFGATALLDIATGFTRLRDPTGKATLAMGSSGNFYDNDGHTFRNRTATTMFKHDGSTFTISGLLVDMIGTFQVKNAQPIHRWIETGVTADNGTWEFRADAETFKLRVRNDALTTDATVFNVDRTGNTIDQVTFSAPVEVGKFGANGITPITKPTVTGSRGGNAALASLLTAMANYGLITDSSTA